MKLRFGMVGLDLVSGLGLVVVICCSSVLVTVSQ